MECDMPDDGSPVETAADSAENSNEDSSADIIKEDGDNYSKLSGSGFNLHVHGPKSVIQQEINHENTMALQGIATVEQHCNQITTESDIDVTAKMLPSGGTESHFHGVRTAVSETSAQNSTDVGQQTIIPDPIIDYQPKPFSQTFSQGNSTAIISMPCNVEGSSETKSIIMMEGMENENDCATKTFNEAPEKATFQCSSLVTGHHMHINHPNWNSLHSLQVSSATNQINKSIISELPQVTTHSPKILTETFSNIGKSEIDDTTDTTDLYSDLDEINKVNLKSSVNDKDVYINKADKGSPKKIDPAKERKYIWPIHPDPQPLTAPVYNVQHLNIPDIVLDKLHNTSSLNKVWHVPASSKMKNKKECLPGDRGETISTGDLDYGGKNCGEMSTEKSVLMITKDSGAFTGPARQHMNTSIQALPVLTSREQKMSPMPTEVHKSLDVNMGGSESQSDLDYDLVKGDCTQVDRYEEDQICSFKEKGQQNQPPFNNVNNKGIEDLGFKQNDTKQIEVETCSRCSLGSPTAHVGISSSTSLSTSSKSDTNNCKSITHGMPISLKDSDLQDHATSEITIQTEDTEHITFQDRCPQLVDLKDTSKLETVLTNGPPNMGSCTLADCVGNLTTLKNSIKAFNENDSPNNQINEEHNGDTELPEKEVISGSALGENDATKISSHTSFQCTDTIPFQLYQEAAFSPDPVLLSIFRTTDTATPIIHFNTYSSFHTTTYCNDIPNQSTDPTNTNSKISIDQSKGSISVLHSWQITSSPEPPCDNTTSSTGPTCQGKVSCSDKHFYTPDSVYKSTGSSSNSPYQSLTATDPSYQSTISSNYQPHHSKISSLDQCFQSTLSSPDPANARATSSPDPSYHSTDLFPAPPYQISPSLDSICKNMTSSNDLPNQGTMSSKDSPHENTPSSKYSTHQSTGSSDDSLHQNTISSNDPPHQNTTSSDDCPQQSAGSSAGTLHQNTISSNDSPQQRATSSDDPPQQSTGSSDDLLHQNIISSDDPPHQRTTSSDDPLHQSTGSSDDPLHQNTISAKDPSHQSMISSDNHPRHRTIFSNVPAHQSTISSENTRHQRTASSDDNTQQSSSSSDDILHQNTITAKDPPHQSTISSDDPQWHRTIFTNVPAHQSTISSEDQPHQNTASFDDPPHHSLTCLDDLLYQRTSPSDDPPHKGISFSNDQSHHSSSSDDPPLDRTTSLDDPPHQSSISFDDLAHQKKTSSDDILQHKTNFSDDPSHKSTTYFDDLPYQSTTFSDDLPHQRTTPSDDTPQKDISFSNNLSHHKSCSIYPSLDRTTSSGDPPHQSTTAFDDPTCQSRSSSNDLSQENTTSTDYPPHKSTHFSDDPLHQRTTTSDYPPNQRTVSSDDPPHKGTSFSNDPPHQSSYSGDPLWHRTTSSDDPPHQSTITSNGLSHQTKTSYDDPPHKSTNVSDDSPHQRTASLNDPQNQSTVSSDDALHKGSRFCNDPPHNSLCCGDPLWHRTTSSDDTPHQNTTTSDDPPWQSATSYNDIPCQSTTSCYDPPHKSSNVSDDPPQKNTISSDSLDCCYQSTVPTPDPSTNRVKLSFDSSYQSTTSDSVYQNTAYSVDLPCQTTSLLADLMCQGNTACHELSCQGTDLLPDLSNDSVNSFADLSCNKTDFSTYPPNQSPTSSDLPDQRMTTNAYSLCQSIMPFPDQSYQDTDAILNSTCQSKTSSQLDQSNQRENFSFDVRSPSSYNSAGPVIPCTSSSSDSSYSYTSSSSVQSPLCQDQITHFPNSSDFQTLTKPIQEEYGTLVKHKDHAFLEELRKIYLDCQGQGVTILDSGIVLSKNLTLVENNIALVKLRDGSELGMLATSSKLFFYYQLGKHFCIIRQLSEHWYCAQDRITKATMLMKQVPVTSNWMKLLHNFLLLPEHPRLLTPYAAITNRNGSVLFLMEDKPLPGARSMGMPPLRFEVNIPARILEIMFFLRYCKTNNVLPRNIEDSVLYTPEGIWFDPSSLDNSDELCELKKCLKAFLSLFLCRGQQEFDPCLEALLSIAYHLLEEDQTYQAHVLFLSHQGPIPFSLPSPTNMY